MDPFCSICCKETSRCKCLIVQAFCDMHRRVPRGYPLRRQHLLRRQRRQRGGGAPLPPHGARRGHGDLERRHRLLGAECGDVASVTGGKLQGFTALHVAASFDRAEVCRVLLAAKAETEARDERFGPGAFRGSLGVLPHCSARPRRHPAALGGDEWPRRGGEGAAGGQSLGRGDQRQLPGVFGKGLCGFWGSTKISLSFSSITHYFDIF